MKVRNLQARVVMVHILGEEKNGLRPVDSTLFLKPGFNDVPEEVEAQVREAIDEYVDAGVITIINKDDPFQGSVEKVVAAVRETWDRDLLEEVRKTAKSRKVKDEVDAQLKRITDHREAS